MLLPKILQLLHISEKPRPLTMAVSILISLASSLWPCGSDQVPGSLQVVLPLHVLLTLLAPFFRSNLSSWKCSHSCLRILGHHHSEALLCATCGHGLLTCVLE